jgi:hypothetical protein
MLTYRRAGLQNHPQPPPAPFYTRDPEMEPTGSLKAVTAPIAMPALPKEVVL